MGIPGAHQHSLCASSAFLPDSVWRHTMLKSFALAAAMSLAAFAVAHADGSFANANLASPVAKPTQVIAGGAVWTCDGAS